MQCNKQYFYTLSPFLWLVPVQWIPGALSPKGRDCQSWKCFISISPHCMSRQSHVCFWMFRSCQTSLTNFSFLQVYIKPLFTLQTFWPHSQWICWMTTPHQLWHQLLQHTGKLLHSYLHISHDTTCHDIKYPLNMAESCEVNIRSLFR